MYWLEKNTHVLKIFALVKYIVVLNSTLYCCILVFPQENLNTAAAPSSSQNAIPKVLSQYNHQNNQNWSIYTDKGNNQSQYPPKLNLKH